MTQIVENFEKLKGGEIKTEGRATFLFCANLHRVR